jgi:hypothetical protein
MSELWTYQVVEYVTPPTEGQQKVPPDLAGYGVEAADGHIGKIDEAT